MTTWASDPIAPQESEHAGILTPPYSCDEMIQPLASDFQSTGYVHLLGLLRTETFGLACVEMMELKQRAKRRHFMMAGFETKRRLATVGGQVIRSVAPRLVNLYSNAQLRSLLVVLTGGEVRPCAHPQEFMVGNFLSEPGDTHGWHVDDPPYALILFFESPAVGHGGDLEFIPDWHRFCVTRSVDPYHAVEGSVDLARREGLVEVRHHEVGDAYLLRADTCLHRVTPLTTSGDNRSVINMAFEANLEVDYGDTASFLYDDGSDQEVGEDSCELSYPSVTYRLSTLPSRRKSKPIAAADFHHRLM